MRVTFCARSPAICAPCGRWDFALARAGQSQAAADVLQRALAAQPSHYQTHLQLAQVWQQLGDGERAIWHAERAYDQQPAAPAADLIRSLYRQRRGQEIDSLQLTPAAKARQHIRANRLGDAISTLDQTLQDQPQRMDLQLLRARALWLDGQRVDAAEAAADILDTLPFSLEALRILAELWLAEGRPSDAAPYLRRIEALDPYLAGQLASGQTAPDNLVTLTELDDSAIVRRQPAPQPQDDDSAEAGLSDARIDELFQELVIRRVGGGSQRYRAADAARSTNPMTWMTDWRSSRAMPKPTKTSMMSWRTCWRSWIKLMTAATG